MYKYQQQNRFHKIPLYCHRVKCLKKSVLLNIMFHTLIGRFMLELFIFIIYRWRETKFSRNVLKEGHELKTIEENMSIIRLENNHRKINAFEEIEILKAAFSKCLLNDVIAGQNDPIYKLLSHQ